MASLAAAEASVSPDDPIFHKPALPEVGHSWSCWEQGLQACLSGRWGGRQSRRGGFKYCELAWASKCLQCFVSVIIWSEGIAKIHSYGFIFIIHKHDKHLYRKEREEERRERRGRGR